MMKVINFESIEQIRPYLERPTIDTKSLFSIVEGVFENVSKNGDTALLEYTKNFDKVEFSSPKQMIVCEEEINSAEENLSPELKSAIKTAAKNIETFHAAQKTNDLVIEPMNGIECQRKAKPIEKVGLYIPGGSAPLFSTVLMLGIPARIAGCKEIILCSPPNTDKKLHPAILFAAKLCGISNIFKVGGSQAIAGMSIGTETIPKVYKIFGPGNQYVTAAKQLCSLKDTAIDMPAGPSEVMVVADETSDADFIAADLLSQAEHGKDSQVVLVSTSDTVIEKTQKSIDEQLSILPRKEMAKVSLENGVIIKVKSKEEALQVANKYAAEHLILQVEDEDFFIENITSAGSVFIGNYTPESAGDYASGTNHTLPTNGFARQYSGVSLSSFQKFITYQKISKQGLLNLGPAIEIMAENEELFAHKNAVTLRLKKISNENA